MLVIRPVAFKQTQAAGGEDLLVGLGHHTAHLAFVILIGPEHIEVFQTNNMTQESGALRMLIKQVLRIPVHVQRPQASQIIHLVIHAVSPVAIGGRRTGVDEPRPPTQGPCAHVFRVLEIITNEVSSIPFGCRRAGTEMIHSMHIAKMGRRRMQLGRKIIRLHVVSIPQRRQMLPLLRRVQTINQKQVFLAPAIQGPCDGAANQPGGPGYHNQPGFCNCRFCVARHAPADSAFAPSHKDTLHQPLLAPTLRKFPQPADEWVYLISYSIDDQGYKYCARHDQRPHGRQIDRLETGLSPDNFARRRQNSASTPAGRRD